MAYYYKITTKVVDADSGAEVSSAVSSAGISPTGYFYVTNTDALTIGGSVKINSNNRHLHATATLANGYQFVKFSFYCKAASGSKKTQEFSVNPMDYSKYANYTSISSNTSSANAIDVTLTIYVSKPVTLYYDANGGDSTPASQSASAGSSVTLAAAITMSGYSFAGWLIGSVTYAAGSSYTLSADATAVAQWVKDAVVCTVSFNKNASNVSGGDLPSVVVTEGGSVTLPDAELWDRSGYSFAGWSTTPGATSVSYYAGSVVQIYSSTTFYAVWGASSGAGGHPDSSYSYITAGSILTKTSYTGSYDFLVSTNVSVGVQFSYWTKESSSRTLKVYNYNPSYNPNPSVTTYPATSEPAAVIRAASADGSVLSIPPEGVYQSYSYHYDSNVNSDTHYVQVETRSTTLDRNWKWTAPQLDGYEFSGWYTTAQSYSSAHTPTADEFTVKIGADVEITFGELIDKSNCCLTSINQYTDSQNYTYKSDYTNFLQLRYLGVKVLVLFDANGGDLDDFYREVRYDQPYGSLPVPTRSGYGFLGWFTAASGGSQVSATTTVSDKSQHVLYAHWSGGGASPASYTVTFNPNGGSCNTASKSAAAGSAIGSLPTPTLSGSSFAGWRDADGMQYTAASIMPARNLTLYASWSLSPVTITFNPNGGSCTTASRQVQPNAPVGSLPVATLSGASHRGWFTAQTGGSKIDSSSTFASSTTLYAQWGAASAPLVIVRYKISFVLNGGSLDSAYLCKYTQGVAKTLPSAAQVTKPACSFAGWYASPDLSGSPATSIPASASGSKTFYAKWS